MSKKSIPEIFTLSHDTSITYYCKEFNLLLTDILTFWFIPIKYRLELQNVTFTSYKFLPYKVTRTIINSILIMMHNSVYEWEPRDENWIRLLSITLTFTSTSTLLEYIVTFYIYFNNSRIHNIYIYIYTHVHRHPFLILSRSRSRLFSACDCSYQCTIYIF